MTSRLRLTRVIGFLALVAAAANIGQAAELRRTVDGKTVHRRVSYDQPAQWIEVAPDEQLVRPIQSPGVYETPGPYETIGAPGGGSCGGGSCGGGSCASCAGGGHGRVGWGLGRGSCGSNCNRPCGYWADFDLLLWWRRGRDYPPLVTTSPPGTDAGDAGVLGLPGTRTLFGDESTGGNARVGGRITLGKWLDSCKLWAVEARYFSVGDSPVRFGADGTTTPILARPFFNVSTGAQDSQLVAFPNLFSGRIDIESRSEIHGGEIYFRRLMGRTACWRFDFLAGYAVSRIDDDLLIRSDSTVIDSGSIEFGTEIEIADLFDARNEFHGGEIGFMSEYQGRCWRMRLLGKIALGNMAQHVAIRGQTTTTLPGADPETRDGGLLAQATNSGEFEREVFAVVPELGVNFAYRLHPCVDLTLGYNLIYWSRVARAGDQINLLVNPTQAGGELDGAPQPEFIFRDTSYWVQGLSFGVECRF